MEYQSSHLTILTTVVVVFIAVLLKARNKRKIRSFGKPNLAPGPWRLPIIGNLHQLAGALLQHRLRDLANKYGPVMSLQLGRLSAVVISSPDGAREVMKTHDATSADRPFVLCQNIIAYNCLGIAFRSHGDYWREMRKILVSELLNTKRLLSFRSIREEEVSCLVQSISSTAGSAFNLSDMLFSTTNCIIAKSTFGQSWEHGDAFKPFVHRIMDDLGGFSIIDMFPSSKYKLLHLISGVESRVRAVHDETDVLLEDVLAKRIENRAKAGDARNSETKDMIDVYLDLQNQPDLEFSFTKENVKALIMDICVPGSESSATVVEWAMAEMIKNPRIMKKAQDEVRQFLSKKETVEEADLHHFEYLKLVLKETLRVYPPGPLLVPRENKEKIQINGYDIPARTKIIINAWAIGRDPRYWKEPEQFYPERFKENPVDYKGMDFQFIPFGSGRRICPGISHAMNVSELLLANLLFHFDWKLPDEVKSESLNMTGTFGLVARRKNDLQLIADPYMEVH